MDAILICPGERPGVGYLAQAMPLVAMPLIGESLVGYWMEFLANSGAKNILVLATDRPELVRSALGDGSRWGVRVQVQAELKELTPAEAAAKYQFKEIGPFDHPAAPVRLIDHFPELPELRLFRTYRDWFAALLAWMPRPAKLNRIGLREAQPQVWCGRRTHVAPTAQLRPPCWLGDHVRVGPDALIGPNAIIESRVVIDNASEICSSAIGPDTFVGSLTRIEGSIAWGNTLVDWRTGSCTQVPDPFLLCALSQRYLAESGPGPLAWLRRGFSALLSQPWALIADLQHKFRQH